MKAYDFEYDGICLSDFGFMICKFGGSGIDTISNGSQIEFNTVSVYNGTEHELVSSQYNECLETTLQICKNPCFGDELEISRGELRDLNRWLNRKEFHKFKLLSDDYLDLFFEASFNISRIETDGKVVGLELHIKTNRPFALKDSRSIVIKNTIENGKKTIFDTSDEEGYIYPKTEITVQNDGNFSLYNDFESRTTVIKNCKAGEVITLNYPMIESSVDTHNIQNDFNWTFFRIANSFRSSKNELTISIPCTIKLTYSPIVKLGI